MFQYILSKVHPVVKHWFSGRIVFEKETDTPEFCVCWLAEWVGLLPNWFRVRLQEAVDEKHKIKYRNMDRLPMEIRVFYH